MTWQFSPVLPPAVIVLIGVALAAALAAGSRLLIQKHVPRRSIVVLGMLRVGMIVLVVLGLFQPMLSLPRTVVEMPSLLVLVDSSASMSSPAAEDSRFDHVKRQLVKSPALEAAARNHTLHWFTFDRRATPTTAAELAAVAPNGDETDVAESLKSAWNHVRLLNASRESSATPQRALIVSDGQHRGSGDVVAAAKELGVALDVLAPARAADQPAMSAAEIVLVQAAQRVLIGSETAFQVTIRPHLAVDRLTLLVEENGQEIQRQEVTGLIAGQDHFATVTHRPKKAGLKRYRFQLLRGTAEDGHPTSDVAYAVNVPVVDDRHDVLILEDSWRWEFKYLRRVLEDDPSFSLTALLARGENAFVQFGEPERRVKLGGFPQSRSELDGFDTIVLGDIRPSTWPRGLARNIAGAVTDGGKSLIVMAGAHLEEWIDAPELIRLLPVELTRESGTPLSGQIDVRLTPEGKTSSWFTLTGASGRRTQGDQSQRRQTRESSDGGAATDRSLTTSATSNTTLATLPSETLPTLEHVYPVLRKRPLATVLLEAATQQNAYGPLPIIVEQTAGRGRVLFLGTDTLWRWQTYGPRTDDGVTLHSSFWQQAFRAFAPTEKTSAQRQLFLRPERTQYRVGDSVRITTELSSTEQAEVPTLEGTVVLPDGRRLPLALPADEHRIVAQFEPSQPGRYRLEVVARQDSQNFAEGAVAIEVTPRGSETDGSPIDTANLARWSSATGGRIIDPTQPDGWIARELPSPPPTTRLRTFDLWHNFAFLLLLCVLQAVDWTIRLFRGYV